MAGRGGRSGHRAALERKPVGRGRSLFTGLFMGLAAGLLIAAGLAWYFYAQPSGIRSPEPSAPDKTETPGPAPVTGGEPPAMEVSPPPSLPAPDKTGQAEEPAPPPAKAADPGYSFYDILPGDKPAKPKDLKLPREVWWLQVAALKAEKDANALKARLALLGLEVKLNRVDTPSGPLHRVRVGPFKTEDDALGALDTLAVNDYEPRLFKEQLPP